MEASPEAPPDLSSREWGFLFFDEGGMRRHRSFYSPGELADYVRSMVPRHVYHSAAYYGRPAAPTMKEKAWQGADLIFDLDADHLRNAPRSYGEMLSQVKAETQKLLGFLMADFGFSEKLISIVFSGGRGYHIHVRDPRVLSLGGDERREIVDYLTGRGLDVNRLSYRVRLSGDVGSDNVRALRCPPENSPGWGGRFNSAIVKFAEEIREMDEKSALDRLTKIKGIGEVRAVEFYNRIKRDLVLDDIRSGNLDSLKNLQGIWRYVIDHYLAAQFVEVLGGETDEPVTADVRRLIRCPGSLHGGSGLRVTSLSLRDMEDFDPLYDAVVFGDEPLPLQMLRPFKTEMKGQRYDLAEGPEELSACVAIFLMARGVAVARAR
ncbi:MAG TPA: DNA primase catalytic subunit PriS [Methanothrix sp.]|nr:DNA primase catalytic subunit PriS [Methanothrix sp.]HPC89978.1 DNA primase catalytic subunit PriS [Methanothrix sp.]HQE87513.1 DNA primase catalytic subunit PriS [Methanothrix sp.]HQI68195.1 DNA primase catalytic subunit PriS [Methanothrix sp.]HRS84945.1 DNA primase catalytic subunit PriS [Methanothrix sp.]